LFISDPQLAAQKFRNQNDLDGCEPGAAKGAAAGMERAFGWIHASDRPARLVPGDGHVMSVPCRAMLRAPHGVLLCLLLLVSGTLAGGLSPFQKLQRRRAVEFRKVAS